jgi:dienelactone hydrolase
MAMFAAFAPREARAESKAAAMVNAHNHPGPYDTIDELWEGVDPTIDPLDIQVLDEWTSDSIHYTRLYFTSEYWEGEPVRVYAIHGAPEGGQKLPGILHIHGGGQTANIEWVTFWAKRGYVCVTFDFCGDWTKLDPNRKEFTKWGRFTGGMDVGGRWMRPDARHDPWFHWAYTARRALTLLASHPAVDTERIGIYGISVGGTLTWLVAGTDPRVKAAVPIYGCGYNTYNTPEQKPEDPVNDPEVLAWRELLQPEHYAARVKCPLLFLNASQDFHGVMDRCNCTMQIEGSPIKRQAISPRYNHHIEPREGANLPLWMDWHLKGGAAFPEEPRLNLSVDNGVPYLEVFPDQPGAVTSVEVNYGLSQPWAGARFWRQPRAETTGDGKWLAPMPLNSTTDTISVFANVTYTSGVALSSTMLTIPAKDIAPVKAANAWQAQIDTMDDDSAWYHVNGYTDPYLGWRYFVDWNGPAGEKGFTINPETARGGDYNFFLGTHKVGDAQWRGRDGLRLAVDWFARQPFSELTINAIENDAMPGRTEYTLAIQPQPAGDGWSTIQAAPGDFKTADGKVLAGWGAVNQIQLKGKAPKEGAPVFKNLRWVE